MKVLFIHNSIPEYRVEFMKKLSGMADVHYIVTDMNLAFTIYGLDGNDLRGLSVSIMERWKLNTISKYIQLNKPNIVVLPPPDDFYQFVCGLYSILFAKKHDCKVVFWTEAWTGKSMPMIKRIKKAIHGTMIWLLAKPSDICIASGSRSADYLKSLGISISKIKICYDSSTSPFCKNVDIRRKYDIPQNKKIILYLGRIVARKGLDILIKSINEIKSLGYDICLLVVGDGEFKNNCIQLSKDMSLIDEVRFVGKIQPAQRAAYYSVADVFVLPSYSLGGTIEAWGLTVNESLEQGTPVVSTDAVGAAYDLLDGKCGKMVDERNVNALTRAIVNMITIENKEIIARACKMKYREYSVDVMATEFFRAFEILAI